MKNKAEAREGNSHKRATFVKHQEQKALLTIMKASTTLDI